MKIPEWASLGFKNILFSTKQGQPHEGWSSYGPSPPSHHSQFPTPNISSVKINESYIT